MVEAVKMRVLLVVASLQDEDVGMVVQTMTDVVVVELIVMMGSKVEGQGQCLFPSQEQNYFDTQRKVKEALCQAQGPQLLRGE